VHVGDRAPALTVPDELREPARRRVKASTDAAPEPPEDLDVDDIAVDAADVEFEVGDSVVYPHHGAGQVLKKEQKDVLGEVREYLTIKILHNDMIVMVPTENAGVAGLRHVIDKETVRRVLAVLQDECSDMPKSWNRRFRHNRDRMKSGGIEELAEVVRDLAFREAEKGLSTGEEQMFTRAKKILASEFMYARRMEEAQAEQYLDELLLASIHSRAGSVVS
jgi:CarD family transcriptional regulator